MHFTRTTHAIQPVDFKVFKRVLQTIGNIKKEMACAILFFLSTKRLEGVR